MTNKTWGPLQLLEAHKGDVPENFVPRRRIAAAMQALSERLIRMDASTEELSGWADQLEGLLAEIGERSHRDSRAANKRLFTGQATSSDVFDMMDFDPVGGLSNPVAPQLEWTLDSAEGVEGQVSLGEHYQGPPGRVHGGVVAWLMDAAMGRAMHAAHKLGVTGTLSLRYLASTRLNTPLTLRAHIDRVEGRKLFIEAAIFNGDEKTVQAEGIFLQPKFMAG